MSGRSLFKRYKFFIDSFFVLYKMIPNIIAKVICFLFGNTKLGFLFRYFELKKSSKKVGDNIYVAKLSVFKNLSGFSCGENLSIHEFSYVDAAGGIYIGNNVSIAHNCSLVSFEHTWDDWTNPIKYNPTKLQSITIGNDVWLGCGVRVLAGTVIEDRVVVAAGAVAKGTLESGYLYGGIPAKKLKKL